MVRVVVEVCAGYDLVCGTSTMGNASHAEGLATDAEGVYGHSTLVGGTLGLATNTREGHYRVQGTG